MSAKDNGAAANLGYRDISYTIKQPIDNAIFSFSVYSLLSNGQIFQVLLS